MELQELFDEIKKTAIVTDYLPVEGEMSIGKSKFGGKPHLPESFEWPYYKGCDFEDILKNRPLSFLAQINLEEIAACDREHQLPHKGMLYFFYELCTMKWGFDPDDKGCARVFYVENPGDLQETDFPKDMEDEFMLPELGLSFTSQTDLPDYEEISEYITDLEWDSYEEERVIYGYEELGDEGVSKLLGYADLIQGNMLLECEEVNRGIDCGGIPNIPEEQREALLHDSKEWMLLFQMSTVEKEDWELMFGDCGNIYFYIKKRDLQEKNFDNTWLILQCF